MKLIFFYIFFFKKKKLSMFIFISFRLKLNSKNRPSFSVGLSLAVATNTMPPTRRTARKTLEKSDENRSLLRITTRTVSAVPNVHNHHKGTARSPVSPTALCVSTGVAHTLAFALPFARVCASRKITGALIPSTPL